MIFSTERIDGDCGFDDVSGRFTVTDSTKKLKSNTEKEAVLVVDTITDKKLWLLRDRVEHILKKGGKSEQEVDKLFLDTFSVYFADKKIPYSVIPLFSIESHILRTVLLNLKWKDLLAFCENALNKDLEKLKLKGSFKLHPVPRFGSAERLCNTVLTPGLFSKKLKVKTSEWDDTMLFANEGLKFSEILLDGPVNTSRKKTAVITKYCSDILFNVIKHNESFKKPVLTDSNATTTTTTTTTATTSTTITSNTEVGTSETITITICQPEKWIQRDVKKSELPAVSHVKMISPIKIDVTDLYHFKQPDYVYSVFELFEDITTYNVLYYKRFKDYLLCDNDPHDFLSSWHLIVPCTDHTVSNITAGPFRYKDHVGKLQSFASLLYKSNVKNIKLWFVSDKNHVKQRDAEDVILPRDHVPDSCSITLDVGNCTDDIISIDTVATMAASLAKQFSATEMKVRIHREAEDEFRGDVEEETSLILRRTSEGMKELSRLKKLEIWTKKYKAMEGLVATLASPGVLKELRLVGVTKAKKVDDGNENFHFQTMTGQYHDRYNEICSRLESYHEISCQIPCIEGKVLPDAISSISMVTNMYRATREYDKWKFGSKYTLSRFPNLMPKAKHISLAIPYFGESFYEEFGVNINTIDKAIEMVPNANSIHVDCNLTSMYAWEATDIHYGLKGADITFGMVSNFMKNDPGRDPLYALGAACKRGMSVDKYAITFTVAHRMMDPPHLKSEATRMEVNVRRHLKIIEDPRLTEKQIKTLIYSHNLKRSTIKTPDGEFSLVLKGLGLSALTMLYDCVSRVPGCTSLVVHTKIETAYEHVHGREDDLVEEEFDDTNEYYTNEAIEGVAEELEKDRTANKKLTSIEFSLGKKSADLIILPRFPNLKKITMSMLSTGKRMKQERILAIRLIKESDMDTMEVVIHTLKKRSNEDVRTIAKKIVNACPQKDIRFSWTSETPESDWLFDFHEISDY
jgi:hypothetical protein